MTTTHAGRTFDWSPRFDPRSLNFRAAAGAQELPDTGVLWAHGPVIDQGREGACVGMGCTGAVLAAPSSRPVPPNPYGYAITWYRQAQRKDPWPGENYSGTSVLAGCLVGRQRRLWTGFRWAKNPAELAYGLLDPELGPAIIGVAWSDALYETDPLGVMRAGDLDSRMGHCVLVIGYVPEQPDEELREQLAELDLLQAVESLDEPSYVIVNSWGRGYGMHGLAVAPLSLVRRWFAHHGEFAFPVDRQPATRAGVTGQEVSTVTEPQRDEEAPEPGEEPEPQEQQPGEGTETLHVTAADVQERDRILDPPEELRQESATVLRSPQYVSGRRVRIATTAGTFTTSAGTPVTVRRPQP